MTESAIGKAIPELTFKATEIEQVALPADIAGGWALFYFYPKDDTPGCTKQACAYRDAYQKFIDAGVKVYGVSLDDMDSHGAFKSKFNLNFPLISDPDHALSDALGVYGDHRVERFASCQGNCVLQLDETWIYVAIFSKQPHVDTQCRWCVCMQASIQQAQQYVVAAVIHSRQCRRQVAIN